MRTPEDNDHRAQQLKGFEWVLFLVKVVEHDGSIFINRLEKTTIDNVNNALV